MTASINLAFEAAASQAARTLLADHDTCGGAVAQTNIQECC
jgi:hypothetical protein